MKIRSQSRSTMMERLQMVWTVLETNSVEMPGPKLEGALRWGGTWHVHEDKHGCIIRRRYKQKSSSETGLCSLGKRKCWKTIVLLEKNIPLRSTLSAPPAVHFGGIAWQSRVPSGFAAVTAATGKDVRIVYLAPQMPVKALQSVFLQIFPSRKKPQLKVKLLQNSLRLSIKMNYWAHGARV